MDEREIATLVDDAFKNDRFVLYFQPIYSSKERAFTNAEVLIRIIDQDSRIISPTLFIPYAERTGLIEKIGFTVLRLFLELFQNKQIPHCLKYSVNLSPLQLQQPDFAQKVIALFARYALSFSSVIFEITESVSYDIDDCFVQNINRLRSCGAEFALDDMGKGASDINMMRLLPVNIIKIDKKYVDSVTTDSSIRVLIKNLVLFARANQLAVVAEGIETIEQKEALEKLSCEFLQGYYFSKPISHQELLSFLCHEKAC